MKTVEKNQCLATGACLNLKDAQVENEKEREKKAPHMTDVRSLNALLEGAQILQR